MTQTRPQWWTPADQAELDVLLWDFTAGAFAHREQCSHCREGGPWCTPLVDAFEAVLEWREGRTLRTRATALRARQDFADWEERARAA